MAKSYIQEGKVLDHIAAAVIASGDLVRIGSRLGVALNNAEVGEVVPVQISGVFDMPKTTANVLAVGDMVNFDSSAGELTSGATAAAGDLTDAAMVVEAADGTVSTVKALLGNFGTPS